MSEVIAGVSLSVRNVGGIDEASVEFDPGVTVLVGRNATNRTSLLRALMAALGSDDAALKGDADRGEVELTVDGETYTRTLRREGDTQTFGGDPYLDDPTLADLFAFLLESNEARQAVAREADLRDLAMRPVDTDAIREEIRAKQAERRDIEADLADLADLRDRLPDLEAEKADLQREIREREERLAEIDLDDADLEEPATEDTALDAALDRLRERREELQSTRFDLRTERESLNALETERDDLREALDAVADADPKRVTELDDRLADLRDRRATLDREISRLQTVIQLNEDLLDGEDSGLARDLRDLHDDASPTDRLAGDRTVCWTCGSEVGADAVETTVETLCALRTDRVEEREAIEADIEGIQERRAELESQIEERDRLERRLADVESEIESREGRVADLRERRETLEAEVADLEAEAEELQAAAESELLDRHREANELEFDLAALRDDLADVESEIAEVESRLAAASDLEARKEQVEADIEELRTRIDRLERGVVDSFNEHMATVLDLLGYDNLERIWLERRHTGSDGVDDTVFDLHVVRASDDGTTYEDTIAHLSESEREVTGLVFALAGFLVHDVHEEVPFVLLDSLEAIDADRIAKLVDYFEGYTDYLVVALLPEDARAVDDTHPRRSSF